MKRLLFILLFCSSSAFAQAASNVLTWDYLATDITTYGVTGFTVERKTEDCAITGSPAVFTQIAAVAATVRSYTDTAVIMGATYCYRAAAVNPTAKSAYSNLVGRTVPLAAPPAPSLRPVVGGP